MDDFVFSHSVLDQKQTMQIKYLYIIIYNLFEKGFPPFNDLSKEFKFETEIFDFEYFGKTSSRNGN